MKKKAYKKPLTMTVAVNMKVQLLESSYIHVGGTGGDAEIIPPPNNSRRNGIWDED